MLCMPSMLELWSFGYSCLLLYKEYPVIIEFLAYDSIIDGFHNNQSFLSIFYSVLIQAAVWKINPTGAFGSTLISTQTRMSQIWLHYAVHSPPMYFLHI